MAYPEVGHLALDISKHQGNFDADNAAARGFKVIIGRCSIGYAGRDIRYLENKRKVEALGMPWLSYSVNWPINRQPAREAIATASLLTDQTSPLMPTKVIADIELGVGTHAAGHHTIPGDELYDINREYIQTLEKQVSPIEVIIYTGPWYWNSPKLTPHITGYERDYRLWVASYVDPDGVRDHISPYDINLDLKPWVPYPWKADDIFAWQWTSKGQGRKFGISDSISVDQNVIYDSLPDVPPPPDDPHDHEDIVTRLNRLEMWRERIADVS